MIFSATI